MKNKDLIPKEYEMEVESKDDGGPKDWEVECWAKTLKEAEMIKADEKKMKMIKPYIEKEKMALDKIDPKAGMDGMRKFINKKMSEA